MSASNALADSLRIGRITNMDLHEETTMTAPTEAAQPRYMLDTDRLNDQMVAVMRARAAVVALAGAVVDASEAGAPAENVKLIIEQLSGLLKTERAERKAFAAMATSLNRGESLADQ
jgi:hypothetical protein